MFLHECVEAGLDAAIVHAARIMPLNRIPTSSARSPSTSSTTGGRPATTRCRRCSMSSPTCSTSPTEKEDRSGWPVEERLKSRIIDGDRDGLVADLDDGLADGWTPLDLVNDVLLDGMRIVGELFGSGQMQLPFVLQSAETMKTAVAHLEPLMEKVEGQTSKGRLVLATVKGDVHDIGKNLVDIILTNNGYEVFNLGIKVPIADMVAKVKEVDADAIGMSGLLVKSTLIMRDNLEELNDLGLADVPVLLGGAALTRTYVEKDLREIYEGRVFYGRDAFEGLHTMDRLMTMKRERRRRPRLRPGADGSGAAEAGVRARRRGRPRHHPGPLAVGGHRQPGVRAAVRRARGSSRASRSTRSPEYVNETALFRNQWQYRPEAGEDDDAFKDRIRPQLRGAAGRGQGVRRARARRSSTATGRSTATATTSSCGPTSRAREEATRFAFPRQRIEPWLCIADFFRAVDGGEADYAAFHIVTMGARRLGGDGRPVRREPVPGVPACSTASASRWPRRWPSYWHRRIREEWGFAAEDGPTIGGLFRQQYRGGRYSWGYPACPDLEDNATVARLLGADRLGIEVSEETGWQYQPEQTTSAIICHHPQAKYFVAR